jgi:Domain of unknown function (DUF4194)
MSDLSSNFPSVSFVKAKLLREPIYREDGELWLTVHGPLQGEIRHYFRQIGQELVVDEGEGYAFIRQLEIEGEERIPRLVQRRALSYLATLLLTALREEFLRFDSSASDSTRLVKTRDELRNLVFDFLPETTNQVRDTAKVDAAISRLGELGFVRQLGAAERDTFEIMRIVKARLSPTDLETIKQRLLNHAEPGA